MMTFSLSMRQTQSFRLSQKQKIILKQLEVVLLEKIHGPDISITKVPNSNGTGDHLKCSAAKNVSSTLYIAVYSISDLNLQTIQMHASTTPASLYTKDTNLYINVLHHYGSLANAFAVNGRVFRNAALEEWQTTVIEFLGVLPDSWIAKVVGKTSQAISAHRLKLGIASASENLSELEDDTAQEEILRIQASNLAKLREFEASHSKKVFTDSVKETIESYIKANPGKTDVLMAEELNEQGIDISRRALNTYRRKLTVGVVTTLPITTS